MNSKNHILYFFKTNPPSSQISFKHMRNSPKISLNLSGDSKSRKKDWKYERETIIKLDIGFIAWS